MLICHVCGREITATNYHRHQIYHKAQLLLDHTGPHGTCASVKAAPYCNCPDPVYAGRDAVCCCCHGILNNPFVTL